MSDMPEVIYVDTKVRLAPAQGFAWSSKYRAQRDTPYIRADKVEELRDSEKLGKYLARELMMVGDEFGKECHRIQFMVGGYRNEVPAGGMCEESLVSFFTKKLEAMQESDHE